MEEPLGGRPRAMADYVIYALLIAAFVVVFVLVARG